MGAKSRNRKDEGASIADYSSLFDKVAEGQFGDSVKNALYGVCQAVDASFVSEKTASWYDVTDLDESDARKARLDQLLRR